MSDRQEQTGNASDSINRRGFLGAGAGIAVAASIGQGGDASAQSKAVETKSALLPKRKLGRTGVEVSILFMKQQGLKQPDGAPVKDLNDVFLMEPARREAFIGDLVRGEGGAS